MIESDAGATHNVFFHTLDVDTRWIEESGRFRCDVVEDGGGLRCTNIQTFIRDRNQDHYGQLENRAARSEFGHQKDNTKRGVSESQSRQKAIDGVSRIKVNSDENQSPSITGSRYP